MEKVGLNDMIRFAVQIPPGFSPSQVHSSSSNLYNMKACNFYGGKEAMNMHSEGHYEFSDRK